MVKRMTDVSGTSGTGIVAAGCVFPNGKCIVAWHVKGMPNSVEVWDSFEEAENIHGHGGATVCEFIDE